MRYWQIAIVFISSVFISSVSAWQCDPFPEEWAKKATIIFEGTVINISPGFFEKSNGMTGRDITFEVTKTISGKKYSEITVTTGLFGVSPGCPFLCGSKYIVYACHSEHGISTNVCYANKSLDNTPSFGEFVHYVS